MQRAQRTFLPHTDPRLPQISVCWPYIGLSVVAVLMMTYGMEPTLTAIGLVTAWVLLALYAAALLILCGAACLMLGGAVLGVLFLAPLGCVLLWRKRKGESAIWRVHT